MRLFLLSIVLLSGVSVFGQTMRVDWQKEAIRRFPELGQDGSDFNVRFLQAVKSAKLDHPELFSDPQWPITIAEKVAAGIVSTGTSDQNAAFTNKAQSARGIDTNLALQKIEKALEENNIATLLEACSNFSHKSATFRANVSEARKQIAIARSDLEKAQQLSQQVKAEVSRIRKNADVSEKGTALSRHDGSNQTLATDQRSRANDLENAANKKVAQAHDALIESLGILTKVVQRIRQSDAEDAERAAKERLAAERLKAIQLFLSSIQEPEGRPSFASNATEPSYEKTLDFINVKLLKNGWSLRFGTRSNKFILIHPDGAFFLDLPTLSPEIKRTSKTQYPYLKLETARSDSSIRALDKLGGAAKNVRAIEIPCDDSRDAEKIAKAFRHLIIMSGGKDDPF